MNNIFTVITSINPPTPAVRAHAGKAGRRVILAGDTKTPKDWHCDEVIFVPYEEHKRFALSKLLPCNHYCRKMIAYLTAFEYGALGIIDTDDDNMPYSSDNEFPEETGTFLATPEDLGYINIYKYYSNQHIWPRGLPLRHVLDKFPDKTGFAPQKTHVGIWQGLADNDPDVDAIYRLTATCPCTFEKRGPLVLGKGTLTPANSQYTMFFKQFFPLLYLPAFVTFRFTDILRGFVAQIILWSQGSHLGFIDASVYQERNKHDLMSDFEQEIPVFMLTEKAVEAIMGAVSTAYGVTGNMERAYQALYREGIVSADELKLLDIWLKYF